MFATYCPNKHIRDGWLPKSANVLRGGILAILEEILVQIGVFFLLFNSYEFIFLFLPAALAGFFLLGRFARQKQATLWLVAASFFFYGWWDIRYVPLLFASICFNYQMGKKIEAVPSKRTLFFAIAVNVALLGYFKYTDFFLGTLNVAFGSSFDLPHIVLPLGISFFTFTQTAYLVDVYRGEAKNESFLLYLEFVTIFPHLIAGPIISYKEMLPQFMAKRTFRINYDNIALGLTIFALGLFKKVVIADKLALWANSAFAHTATLTFLEAWIGAVSYTFQLYFDFSGYSEMAIGLGLLFNLHLPTNFNSPYQAESMIDFWRRWHMTLGTWVRDYLYIPLGGNRQGEWAKMRNLFVSMLIIGLWHGAGWTFVFWGAMHGVCLMVNHQWRRLKITLPKSLNIALTFLCVMLLWVFFRAESFTEAWQVLTAMTDIGNTGLPAGGSCQHYLGGLAQYGAGFANWSLPNSLPVILLSLCMLAGILLLVPNPLRLTEKFQPNNRWLIVTAGLLLYALLHLNSYSEFLYFQF